MYAGARRAAYTVILKHMDIAVDPGLLVHVQTRLNICKLAVQKHGDKEIDRIEELGERAFLMSALR